MIAKYYGTFIQFFRTTLRIIYFKGCVVFMVSASMFKKIIVPILYVAEWICFFYVAISILVLNLGNFTNIVAVDMPFEEPITLTSSFVSSLSLVIAVALICFFYIKYLIGSKAYQEFKRVVWGILFGLNTISCVIYGSMVYGFDIFHANGILLSITALLSGLLTFQIITKDN